MSRKANERKEKPFEEKKIYFSGSIHGVQEYTPGLFQRLVEFMKKGGADVLSEHVAKRTRKERDRILYEKTGIKYDESETPWILARITDLGWVDEADYFVAEVTSPSLGVGMEIQRAIDKDELGLNHTKILCLCRQDVIDDGRLSWMVRGVTRKNHADFYLVGYTTIGEAEEIVSQFLTDTSFQR